jgi:hypothetical protein
MAEWKTLLRVFALGGLASLSALCACGSGEVKQTVFTIESFCTFSPRLAIVVEVNAASDMEIDSVTATHESEQRCYLERASRDSNADDAGERNSAVAAVYSCLAQGEGTYAVHVTSGQHTWTQSIEVFGDKCHVTELQKLTFELD